MRIPPAIKLIARKESPFLPLLLPTLRDLDSARRELRWITEHFTEKAGSSRKDAGLMIRRACYLRGVKSYPLQYILGSQPFGESLDIKCRRGVLIPRWETDEWGMKVASGIRRYHPLFTESKQLSSDFTVLDLCTGSGCLALLFAEQLGHSNKKCHITGIDVSDKAYALANENLYANKHVIKDNVSVSFAQCDIFSTEMNRLVDSDVDIVISNPPYVSEDNYNSAAHTESSVRKYEPRLALIGGVEFYKRIFEIATLRHAKAVVCELADEQQFNDILAATDGILNHQQQHKSSWNVGAMHDGAGVVRTIIAWRRDADKEWGWLRNLVNILP
ncbi:S-adenosyl-L-methionine-dependent methyltransferase [Myxozyma melibiosi]|uniref:S-adenosyl-L-methionine-dependent methyltransferase n=1 Tax=Myxozyma melibiosi TaxID=54550 RepID=A0ABR1F4E6_9ASCO